MHRRRRWATAVAFTVMAGSVSAVTSAAEAAGTPATLYVNNTVSTCSDSGSGTEAVPFCNVQPAFSAATAGVTVIIEAGKYGLPATLTASGTAAAPITVSFGVPGSAFPQVTSPSLVASSTPALTVANASYIDIDNAYVTGGSAAAVSVTGSSHVTFAGGEINGGATGLAISGTSSDVSATRAFLGGATAAVNIGPGVTGTVIATDSISGGDGVVVDGASGTDVVGNDMSVVCDTNVSVSGGATGTVIENNVIDMGLSVLDCTAPSPLGLGVDADSAAGTTEKYDTILAWTSTPIEWAGTEYDTVAAYQAATGQGAQDLIRSGVGMHGKGPADYVDNADASAPGETSTDFSGNPREDDPYVTNTGTGVGYYDRGDDEETDSYKALLYSVTPVAGTASTFTLLWGHEGSWALCPNNYTTTIDWGDGTTSTSSGTSCATAPAAAHPATVSPAGLRGCTVETCATVNHTYASPGKYEVTFTSTDGTLTTTKTADVSTQAADYIAYGPSRILDTRSGVGASKAKVKQGSYVRLKVAGVGSIPADVSAVALNLTVTGSNGNGFVAAEADGVGTPTISNLNYGTGQTIANAAIVSVAPDGYIDIYNSGAGTDTADLIADVTGYFRPAAASGYAPVTLSRILDTRKGNGAPQAKVAAGGSVPVAVAGVDSIPASGVTAVAVHVTVTDTVGNGWIAAVPDGAAKPSTSTLNYGKGQTVSNTVIVPVGADGKIRLYNGGGTTPVDLVTDVAGYFSAAAPNAYVPLSTASRVVDTRKSGSTALQPNTPGHYWISTNTNANVVAMVGNLTVTQTTAVGFITAYPDGGARPNVSNVNFAKGQTVANLAVLDTNSSEQPATNVYNSSNGTTQLVIDVFGYFGS